MKPVLCTLEAYEPLTKKWRILPAETDVVGNRSALEDMVADSIIPMRVVDLYREEVLDQRPTQGDVVAVVRSLWGIQHIAPDWNGAIRFNHDGARWRATGRNYPECVFAVELCEKGKLIGSAEAATMQEAMHEHWFVPGPSLRETRMEMRKGL